MAEKAYRGVLKTRISKLYGGDVTIGKAKKLKARPNATNRDSYAPLEIGDELRFTGDFCSVLAGPAVIAGAHTEFAIVVDAEFLRTISAGKISGRQNGTWVPATTHDRYWTGNT